LVEIFFPGVPIKSEIKDADTLVSIEKAKALIGYQPEYPITE